jgi:hypothetical protein
MSPIEDDYFEVLLHLESAIMSVYHENSDLTDYDVDKALNALWMEYRSETQGKTKTPPPFSANQRLVYDRVKFMCEWRLGRQELKAKKNQGVAKPEPLSLEEVGACLKRIRKSIELWTKEGGRQGYLYFMAHNSGL